LSVIDRAVDPDVAGVVVRDEEDRAAVVVTVLCWIFVPQSESVISLPSL
jgi:hypothetical protein